MSADKPGSAVAPTVFMRHGGTPSSRQQREDAKLRQDTQRRRAIDAQRRKVEAASRSGDPRAGLARSFNHRLASHDDHMVVVLNAVNKDGSIMDYIVCELTYVQNVEDPELMLHVVCPRCVFVYGRPMGESQMRIRQSNRKFYLDERSVGDGGLKGAPWVNPNDPSEIYTQAGEIHLEERTTCPALGCGYSFKIGEYRGVKNSLKEV
jgi:hypothetical protein